MNERLRRKDELKVMNRILLLNGQTDRKTDDRTFVIKQKSISII